MTAIEICLVAAGLILMVGSFFVTEKLSPDELDKIAKLSQEEIAHIVDKEIAASHDKVQEQLETELEEVLEKLDRESDKETNEKIMAIRFHVLTSLRAGRQFFSSPFAHYSFCGRLFWPALPGKIKIIFSVAHLCAPFVLIGWVAGSGKGRSAGTVETSPITTKSACLQNADRRRRIIKSIYMISVFILIARIVRWRGYAFFNWCRSWTLRKSKKDTAIPPRYRRVLKKGRL